MAATTQPIVILGSNDSSYRLLQLLADDAGDRAVCMVQDSVYGHCPAAFYPDLLAGNLPLQDIGVHTLSSNKRRTEYRQELPDDDTLQRALIINTHPDPQHISVLRFPDGRQRCLALHHTGNIMLARNRLASHGGLLVYGSSLQAVLYAAAAARAGYRAYLAADADALIHRGFDSAATTLIHQHLQQSGVTLLRPHEVDKEALRLPALYTPFNGRSPAVSKVRHTLKSQWQELPVPHFQLQHGADWYQLPEQVYGQLVQRIGQESHHRPPHLLARLWQNKSGLPHRFSINNLVIHYAGLLQPEHAGDCITMSVPECGIYRKIILAGNRIAGFLLAGDVSGSDLLADMMLTHRNINDCRDELIFIGH